MNSDDMRTLATKIYNIAKTSPKDKAIDNIAFRLLLLHDKAMQTGVDMAMAIMKEEDNK
jgi:uncharacterized ferredoxin-like protein